MDNRADNRADNREDNRADNWADKGQITEFAKITISGYILGSNSEISNVQPVVVEIV